MAERTGFGRGRLFALIEGNKSEASNPFADGNRSKPDEEEKPKAHGAGRGSLILAAAAAKSEEPTKISSDSGRGRGMLKQMIGSADDTVESTRKSLEKTQLPSGNVKSGTSSGVQIGFGRGRLAAMVQSAQKDLVHDKAQVATSEKSNPLQKVAGRPVMFGKIPGELERFADDQTVFSTSTVAEPVEVPGAVIVPKIGGAGDKFSALTNYVRLKVDKDRGVFEYEVRFEPNIHAETLRRQLIRQHENVLGRTRLFDGMTLALPFKLPDQVTSLSSKNENDGTAVQLTLIYKRQKKFSECKTLYGRLFDRIMKVLKFVRFTTKNFDPTAPKPIAQHKLEVWPGFVTSVDECHDGVMLCVDVTHRVLRTQTVLELMVHAYQSARNNMDLYKKNVQQALIGAVVLTRYNNKTYRIDDIDFEKTPSEKFKNTEGHEMAYIEYYKSQYGIQIKDLKQPLLISRKEVRTSATEKKELVFALIPEICFLTGLTDEQRKDFKVMRDVASITRISPNARCFELARFCKRVNSNEETRRILSDWGLTLADNGVDLQARQLPNEKVEFGKGKTFAVGDNGDFSKYIGNNEMLSIVHLNSWMIIHPKNVAKEAKSFVELMQRNARPMGVSVAAPNIIVINDDRTDTFASTLRVKLTANTQIVVCICQNVKGDCYATIKKICCAECPIPSQVINARTLSNDAKNRSIVQKIALQMNCKLGGSLWAIKIPLANTMICGIDSYHEAGASAKSVSAFVASLNGTFTKWYSKAIIQNKREELVHGLVVAMKSALDAYKVANKMYPERIIIYRDGVGDGQLDTCKQFEVKQLKTAFSAVGPDCSPKLTFVVVQKRINTRFFKKSVDKKGDSQYNNPDPGSVLDHTITRKNLYDFYLIPQSVRNATVTPSHYIVLEDQIDFKPDILQRVSYKLCYMYYNWPGAVRVPACCQYAHKLCALVGESMKRDPAEVLSDKLYYL